MTSAAAPTTYVSVRGLRLALSDEGAGPVVLNAHGLTGSRALGRAVPVLDLSPVVSTGRRLVSYDARGHGESEGTREPDDYTWRSLGADLLALADVVSPGAAVSAIGSSMGTGSLLWAVTAEPGRFERLVLTTSPTAWETRAGQGDGYRLMADIVETGDPEVTRRIFAEAVPPPVLSGIEGFPPAPDVPFDILPSVLRGAAMADFPARDLVRAITQPTLVLAWPGDAAHPLATAHDLAALIPDCRLQVSDTLADVRMWGTVIADFLTT